VTTRLGCHVDRDAAYAGWCDGRRGRGGAVAAAAS
jgi:hypothetical protein